MPRIVDEIPAQFQGKVEENENEVEMFTFFQSAKLSSSDTSTYLYFREATYLYF